MQLDLDLISQSAQKCLHFGIDPFRKISSDKESMVVIIEKATMTTADIDGGELGILLVSLSLRSKSV